MDGLHELGSKGMIFLAPATGEVDKNIVIALRAVDNLDIFGPYLPTNKSVNGAPVYAKQQYADSFEEEDHELNMWHFSEGNQWYVGPRDRIGSPYGVAKAQVQRWGAGGIPQVPTKAWEIHDGSSWLPSGVQLLSPAELEVVYDGAAFQVLALVDIEGRTRTFEYMGEFMYGRPRYRTTSDGKGRRLDLWWHESLESWCVGPLREAERQGKQASSVSSWHHCHLRALDPALLPEWIIAPWTAMEPRWRAYQGAENVKVQSGGTIIVGKEVPSFTYVPGQVMQLPLTSTLMVMLNSYQLHLRLAIVLAALTFVSMRHFDKLARASDHLMARLRRAAAPKRRKPRPTRQQPRPDPAPAQPPAHGAANADECCVCLSKPKTHLLLPCGHKCLCEDCVTDFAMGGVTCPLCREPVENTARVYE
jgi:hypothetical protein